MAQDLEARFKELEAKVQELYDREAIRDLRYRYHEYVNEGKFADIASLFTEDGVLDFWTSGKRRWQGRVERLLRESAGWPIATGQQSDNW
jgi:SnoaL-like protein